MIKAMSSVRLPSAAIDALVVEFAVKSREMGKLRWSLSKVLSSGMLGVYGARDRVLYVSSTGVVKTLEKFVKIVLHEIQHWNQHVAFVASVRKQMPTASLGGITELFIKRYDEQTIERKKANWFEVDAARFASENATRALAIVDDVISNGPVREI